MKEVQPVHQLPNTAEVWRGLKCMTTVTVGPARKGNARSSLAQSKKE